MACAGCGSPITVPAPSRAQPRPPAPVSQPTARGLVPWGRVAITAGIVAALHIAVYAALTSEARAEMRKIEVLHSATELADAKPPSTAPNPGTPAYTTWRANEAAHQAAHVYGRHEQHHDLVRNGILVSFFAQMAMAGVVIARLAGKAAASSRKALRRS